jgi:type IV secretion system protein VirD4
VSPEKKDVASQTVRIIFTLLLHSQYNTAGAYEAEDLKTKKKKELLVIADEMNQLGRFSLLRDGVSLLRGYGVRLVMIAQDESQLEQNYGKSYSEFLANSTCVYFGASDLRTCETISKKCGNYTVAFKSKSESSGKTTVSDQRSAKALLSVDEVAALPRDVCLIFERGLRPIRAKRLSYYSDKRFAGRFGKWSRQ